MAELIDRVSLYDGPIGGTLGNLFGGLVQRLPARHLVIIETSLALLARRFAGSEGTPYRPLARPIRLT